MDWFQVDSDMVRHPRVVRIAHKLRIPLARAIGHVVMFWSCVAEHAEWGDLTTISDDEVEVWSQWNGPRGKWAAALVDVGLVDAARQVHGWRERHERFLLERERKQRERLADRERKRRQKDNPAPFRENSGGIPAGCPGQSAPPYPTRPDPTEPDDVKPDDRTEQVDGPGVASGSGFGSSGSVEPSGSSGDGPPRDGPAAPAPQSGFEALERKATVVRRWRGLLAEYVADMAVAPGDVERELVATAKANADNQAAYLNRIMDRRDRVREIAVRVREEALEREKLERHGPPRHRTDGASKAESLGDLIATNETVQNALAVANAKADSRAAGGPGSAPGPPERVAGPSRESARNRVVVPGTPALSANQSLATKDHGARDPPGQTRPSGDEAAA